MSTSCILLPLWGMEKTGPLLRKLTDNEKHAFSSRLAVPQPSHGRVSVSDDEFGADEKARLENRINVCVATASLKSKFLLQRSAEAFLLVLLYV